MLNTITFETTDSVIYLEYKFFVIKDRYYIKKIEGEKIATCSMTSKSFKYILQQQVYFVWVTLQTVDDIFNQPYNTIDEYVDDIDEYFDICEDLNKEQNERTFNQILIKNTKNNINKKLPTELIELIISSSKRTLHQNSVMYVN